MKTLISIILFLSPMLTIEDQSEELKENPKNTENNKPTTQTDSGKSSQSRPPNYYHYIPTEWIR